MRDDHESNNGKELESLIADVQRQIAHQAPRIKPGHRAPQAVTHARPERRYDIDQLLRTIATPPAR